MGQNRISLPAPQLSPWPGDWVSILRMWLRPPAAPTLRARMSSVMPVALPSRASSRVLMSQPQPPGTAAIGRWITRLTDRWTHEPLSRFARIAAANLAAANRVIPQVTHHDRADMRAVEAVRAKLKPEAAERGVRLTALAFHVKALATCLERISAFQCVTYRRRRNPDPQAILPHRHCGRHAARTDGAGDPRMLTERACGRSQARLPISPGARRSARSGPTRWAERRCRSPILAASEAPRSRPSSIRPNSRFWASPVPKRVPVWENDSWIPVPMTPLDLSYDHRVINGAEAARFMAHYARLIADPRRMMV
jgi:hypothetical protein